ncbi:hypothetical protein [Nocardia farcinica]|uniref:hypothetical protein n=1 Tax=Nocardia farcinica TaxID=37329 RepID=UPI002454FAD4|nr:hypothetical protein [Nocardia farcinica]
MSPTTAYAMPTGAREQPSLPGLCDIPLGPQQVCEQVEQVVGDAASSAIDNLVDALVDGFARLIRMAMAWWTDFPSPELTGASGEPGSALTAVREYSSGLQVAFLIAGIMFAASRLALAKRGGVAGEAQESLLMLARASFMSMAIAVLVTMGTRAGDSFAHWVIFSASEGDMVGAVDRLTRFDQETRSGLGTGVLLIVGLLGLIGTLVQLVMLVLRQALLILVVAVIPLAAAASGTGPGSQSYKRLLSWALAFVLYKPVGALVYAIAFTVIGDEDQTDPHQILLGLILLLMSVVVLPALVRLVAPAVSTLGSGGGATAVLAGGAAGVAMGSAGDRGNARKVSEGEDAAPGAGPSGGASPSGGGGGSGGGGRPMGGGDGGSAPVSGASGDGHVGSPSGGSGGAARSTAPSGRAAAGSSSGARGAGGSQAAGGAGAAAGGVAGAVVMAAQEVKAAGDQAVSAVEAQTRDAADGGWSGDALGPAEVRR